jgi:hypothetical protein
MPIIKSLLICALLLLVKILPAQDIPVLERKVSIQVTSKKTIEVLQQIKAQCKVQFSYNPVDFDDQKIVSVSYRNISLRLALEDIVKYNSCTFKVRKNYIIFTKFNAPKSSPIQAITLKGYVYSLPDSAAITDASIYLKSTKLSTVSNPYGYFSLNVKDKNPELRISAAKENYKDTTVVIKYNNNNQVKIYLVPKAVEKNIQKIEPQKITETLVLSESTDNPKLLIVNQNFQPTVMKKYFFNFKSLFANYKNIKDTFRTAFSFSVVPNISTNKLLSINTVNNVSLNLLVGYSKGVGAVEVGGLLNIDIGKVNGAQIAGLGNIVTDSVNGFQTGGVFNIVSNHVNGFQSAGVFNIAPSFKGVQIGGVFNTTRIFNGTQISGLFNTNTQSSKGVQIAGVYNFTKQSKGVQVAGVMNTAFKVEGTQIAGVVNYAKQINGTQISGLINIARNVKGVQLSVVNIADSCSGFPIGFFSYIKHGYRKMELSYNELSFLQFSFRTGVKHFHNIFSIGKDLLNASLWSAAYGIGCSFNLSKRLALTTDVTSQQIVNTNFTMNDFVNINKLQTVFEYTISKKLQLGVGPSLNFLVAQKSNIVNQLKLPHTFYSESNSNGNYKMWVGATASVKIL